MEAGSIDELKAKASESGYYMPDSDDTSQLIEEYDQCLKEVDALLEIVDPESKPFESKYKAREALDKMVNKLDATRTVSMLEKKTGVIQAMDFRLAALRTKLGTISWECEEPHNAQTDLDMACEFYFPGLASKITEMVGDVPVEEYVYDGDMPIPELASVKNAYICDAMKCLNILGILWSGRGQLHKAFLYLLLAKGMYTQHQIAAQSWAFSKQLLADTENSYTHTLFYLAQAYGHVGDTKRSSAHCRMTLQRQLQAGLDSTAAALDWSKNCAGIADFYMAMSQYNNCALALSSAEKILQEKLLTPLRKAVAADNTPTTTAASDSTAPVSSATTQDIAANEDGNTALLMEKLEAERALSKVTELEASLHKRWIALDVAVLRRAFDYHKSLREALQIGEDPQSVQLEANPDEDFNYASVAMDALASASTEAGSVPIAPTNGNAVAMPPAPPTSTTPSVTPAVTTVPVRTEFFTGLLVTALPLLSAGDICSFEYARQVFLRAAARLEHAKAYYVLDGYVTDHTLLLQDHSKLYHYLSEFEQDTKRRLAMQSRRFDLLNPLLAALSRSSYELLHKQISYELGEASLAMLDLKLDKIRIKGDIDERMLKKNEVSKINEFCKNAIVNFAHFTWMYSPAAANTMTVSPTDGRGDTVSVGSAHSTTHLQSLPLHELVDAACLKPDESSITTEELRPFLNAHFLVCRALQKVVHASAYAPPNTPVRQGRVFFIAASLRRYEWLRNFAERIVKQRSMRLGDLPFQDEFNICDEMTRLLPAKIDRMCYAGEGGLSL